MSHTLIALLFGGASACALVLLVTAVRTARRAGDLDAASALTFATGLLVILPDALVAATGTLRRSPDVFGDIMAINPSWYDRVDQLALFVLAAFAAILLIPRAASRRSPAHAAGILAILLWIFASFSSGLHEESLVTPRAVVLCVCLLAATVLPRGRGACVGAAMFGVSLAIASGVLGLFRYDVAFIVPCQGACNGLGLTGVLPNENLLAVILTASIPFTYLGFRGRARVWLTLYVAGMAIATGSRTALGASLITLVLLAIVRPGLDQGRTPLARMAVVWCGFLGSVAASIYIVRHDWPSTALTTRPQLWGVAWHYIHESPWFGYGPVRWATLYQSSEIPVAAQRSTHNQWTDVLFVAGGVGAALLASLAIAAILSAGQARSAVLVVLTTISTIGATEGAWSVATIDLLSFSLVAVILMGETAAGARDVRVSLPASDVAGLTRRAGTPVRGSP
jgi:O-antigen ligase